MSQQPIPTVYINNARVSIGTLDFRVYLSEIMPPQHTPDNAGTLASSDDLRDLACLVISPEIADVIAKMLTDAVAKYVKYVAPLRPLEFKADPRTGAPLSPVEATEKPVERE